MDDLNVLISRRGQIKAVLIRFQNYIRSTECGLNQIVHRRKKIEEAWNNFEFVQAEIEELDCENSISHASYRDEFEN